MASREKEYLEYVRNNPEEFTGPKDCFEFNSLSYSVYRRFIELLLPITNHFFRNTSKENYQQCLDLRGIEVEELSWSAHTGYHGELLLYSGKMNLNLNIVRPDWSKWLVVTEQVYIFDDVQGTVPDIKQLNFVKKYKSLYFYNGFAEQLEHLVHPGLKEVFVDCDLDFDILSRFLDKLNVCQHLESFDIWNTNVKSTAVFLKLKQYLEQLSRRHPYAQIHCNLGYKKYFEIHENVLWYRRKPGVFVKDYNFEDLLHE